MFFVVKDNTVITPADDVLMGVTRGLVIELLAHHGFLHAEAEVSLALLKSADEVFLSSTTKHILPITEIDGRKVGKGQTRAGNKRDHTGFPGFKGRVLIEHFYSL